jgi:hypothetical protein
VQILVNYYSRKLNTRKNVFLHNEEQAKRENDVLFFIYVYLSACASQSSKQA